MKLVTTSVVDGCVALPSLDMLEADTDRIVHCKLGTCGGSQGWSSSRGDWSSTTTLSAKLLVSNTERQGARQRNVKEGWLNVKEGWFRLAEKTASRKATEEQAKWVDRSFLMGKSH